MRIGDTVFYPRVHHETGVYDLCELYVRTVYPECFVGVDKFNKRAFIVNYDDIYYDRDEALAIVKEAELMKREFTVDYGE